MTIDLLITKDDHDFKLSDLGLELRSIDDSSPSVDVGYRTVTNRSGRTRSSGRYGVKTIRVAGNFYADSLFDYEELKEEISGRLVNIESYFITKMFPVDEELYEFELPGESAGDFSALDKEHGEYKYRYHVIMVDHYLNFRGRSNRGLLYDFELQFETEGLPFGETESRNITVTNEINYNGTAENSQLESPWFVRLTATQNQQGDFYFTIGERTFSHSSLTSIEAGDEFELRGVETRLNHSNINEYTNYEHFILKQGRNVIQTNFVGNIEIVNFKEFYK